MSCRLFDGLMLYWRYYLYVTQTLNWSYIRCRPVTYILWSSDFVYIVKTIWWTNVINGILDPCNAKIHHIKCMWIVTYISWSSDSDVSWRCFDGGMLDWKYWFNVILSLTYKYICRSVTYTLWYSDSALYFQYYWMNRPHSWNIGSAIWIINLYYMIKWF